MPITLCNLYLLTTVLSNVYLSLQHEIPRRSILIRRAIDGTRGRKYFDPHEEGTFDSFGSAGGQYNPYEQDTDLSDIRRNVPGEPGIDYPAYTTLPQTGFTCEGRSRGYYADEVAGCQVFHVCHDVLVSSFLCPIGSIFSQKLLTCDWWAKVDCSTTQRYIGVSRDTYQPDDDEMIRNAYAMISLHSGKDVTQDGLVDPDRTGSIVDYHRDRGRIIEYPMLDPTANDLRHMLDDYRMAGVREFLSAYSQFQRKQEANRNYQGRLYPKERAKQPPRDSRIIRIQKIEDPHRVLAHPKQNNDFRENYRRPNEFADQFQPSYAPTVPTVTTTTRRFYSPTVPTTYRPSTLAYSKLDQLIDSSDQYYSHTKTRSYVTPPTKVFPGDDSEKHVSIEPAPNTNDSSFNYDEYYEDANLDLEFRTPAKEDTDTIEEINTRESIGLGHALRQSSRKISINQQNPTEPNSKNSNDAAPFDTSNSSAVHNKGVDTYEQIYPKPKLVTSIRRDRNESGNRNFQTNIETTTPNYQATTPQLEKSDVIVPSTTLPSLETTLETTTKPFSDRINEFNSNVSDVSAATTDLESLVSAPANFLTPPVETPTKFQIKVLEMPLQVAPVILGRPSNQPSLEDKNSGESIKTITDNRDDRFEDSPSSIQELKTPVIEIVPPFADFKDNVGNYNNEKNDGRSPSTSVPQQTESTTFPFIVKPIENAYQTEVLIQPSISLTEIEETMDKETQPYQISLPVNINQSSAQESKNTTSSKMGAKENGPELVEPDAEATAEIKSPLTRLDSNTNVLSLRQLMQELLKLNRYPRPFAQAEPETTEITMGEEVRPEDPVDDEEMEKVVVSDPEEILKGSSSQSGQFTLKEQILERLKENFGRPLYNAKEDVPIFELPGVQRSVDFQTGLPLNNPEENEEKGTTLSETDVSLDVIEDATASSTVEIIPIQNQTNNEKAGITKTEFLPSLSFSLDTSEGREEYAEAILEGLINDHADTTRVGNATLLEEPNPFSKR